jgi:hypothetical protein
MDVINALLVGGTAALPIMLVWLLLEKASAIDE